MRRQRPPARTAQRRASAGQAQRQRLLCRVQLPSRRDDPAGPASPPAELLRRPGPRTARPWLDTQHSTSRQHRISPAAAVAMPDAPAAVVSRESKAVGLLLGAMAGNVLGAPNQGERHYEVSRQGRQPPNTTRSQHALVFSTIRSSVATQVTRRRGSRIADFWRYDVGRDAMAYGQYTGAAILHV
jgi:hypothetical protein